MATGDFCAEERRHPPPPTPPRPPRPCSTRLVTSWTSPARTGHLWAGLGFKAAVLAGAASCRRRGPNREASSRGGLSKHLPVPPPAGPGPPARPYPAAGRRGAEVPADRRGEQPAVWPLQPGNRPGPGSPAARPALGWGLGVRGAAHGTREPEPRGEGGGSGTRQLPEVPARSHPEAGRRGGRTDGGRWGSSASASCWGFGGGCI